jgi:hypothetical protein
MLNSDRIYGEAPVRPPITGAPWMEFDEAEFGK